MRPVSHRWMSSGGRCVWRAPLASSLLVLAGCGGARDARPSSATAIDVAAGDARYDARLGDDDVLHVELTARSGAFARLTIEEDAELFLRALSVGAAGEDPTPVALAGARWPLAVPACADAEVGCVVRYSIDLRALAETFQNPQFGFAMGDDLLMPVTSFLLRPASETPSGTFRFALAPGDRSYATGLARAADGAVTARLDDLPQAAYGVFSRAQPRVVEAGDARAEVLVLGARGVATEEELLAWVRNGLEDVRAYLGAYSARPLVLVLVGPGEGIGAGFSLGNGGASVLIGVGDEVGAPQLARDWVMTHELLHTAMPSLASRHNWIEEGFATYAEPIARVQGGRLTPEKVWSEWYVAMWQGQPLPDDGGLDGTRAWGRLYWGGAGFWLAAEVAAFEATNGARTLADCFGRVAQESRGIADRWSIERFLTVCDEGLGVPVVGPLHARMGSEAVELPLTEMFDRLGVDRRRGGVSFRDDAPLAACRRNLERPR